MSGWNARTVFVSHLPSPLEVGLDEVGEGVWSVFFGFFGPLHLGWLDEATTASWMSKDADGVADL